MSTRLNFATPLRLPQCVSTAANKDAYIIALASTPSTYAALATRDTYSAQGHAILLYDLSPSGFTRRQSFVITSKSFPSAMRVVGNFSGRPTLLSSHPEPGCIKVWDERSGAQPVLEIHSPKNRALISFDVTSDGNMLAAGTDLKYDDASILYWDPRKPAEPLHVHSSTHSDDITVMYFHPSGSSRLLLSASSDGLLSISDASVDDEDSAVQEVANWGYSIARAGWFRHQADHSVWAASDMETFGLWNGSLDCLHDCGDIRQPSAPGRWATDYLVDACDFSRAPGPCDISGLTLFLGSNSGDVALATISDLGGIQPTWTVRGMLRGVHADTVVRSVLWDDVKGVLLTGDEAGQLAAWRPVTETIEGDVEMTNAETLNAGAGIKRAREGDSNQRIKRGRYQS